MAQEGRYLFGSSWWQLKETTPLSFNFESSLEVNKYPILTNVLESFRCGGNMMNKDLG
jgi:hypothetical protein